jgi:hypothetical protein
VGRRVGFRPRFSTLTDEAGRPGRERGGPPGRVTRVKKGGQDDGTHENPTFDRGGCRGHGDWVGPAWAGGTGEDLQDRLHDDDAARWRSGPRQRAARPGLFRQCSAALRDGFPAEAVHLPEPVGGDLRCGVSHRGRRPHDRGLESVPPARRPPAVVWGGCEGVGGHHLEHLRRAGMGTIIV